MFVVDSLFLLFQRIHRAYTPEEFTTAVFDKWGVGDAQLLNGIVVMLAFAFSAFS